MAKPVLSNLDFVNAAKIVNLPDPSAAQDAATKAYVDSAVEGLAWKDSCRVSAQVNVTVASPGATIDGVTMAVNDRFLLPAQTAPAENGIYVWNGAAVAATRALDANTAAELEQAVTTVEEGTSAGASFRQTAVNFALGSGAVAWTAFGTAASNASTVTIGISRFGTQAEVDAGSLTNVGVAPSTLAAWSARPKRFASSFGDGSATQYDIAHNLNTVDCHVEIVRVSDGVTVWCDVTRTTVNNVRLNFAVAPSTNQYRCVVVA